MTIEKYINDDGLVGIVYDTYGNPWEKELFDKELVKMVAEKDFKAYVKRRLDEKSIPSAYDEVGVRSDFNDLTVELLKPGTKFRVVPNYDERLYVLTEDDLFTA